MSQPFNNAAQAPNNLHGQAVQPASPGPLGYSSPAGLPGQLPPLHPLQVAQAARPRMPWSGHPMMYEESLRSGNVRQINPDGTLVTFPSGSSVRRSRLADSKQEGPPLEPAKRRKRAEADTPSRAAAGDSKAQVSSSHAMPTVHEISAMDVASLLKVIERCGRTEPNAPWQADFRQACQDLADRRYAVAAEHVVRAFNALVVRDCTLGRALGFLQWRLREVANQLQFRAEFLAVQSQLLQQLPGAQ